MEKLLLILAILLTFTSCWKPKKENTCYYLLELETTEGNIIEREYALSNSDLLFVEYNTNGSNLYCNGYYNILRPNIVRFKILSKKCDK